MLYLIKLDNTYKIGFTDNIKQRISTLSATHLEIKIVATREGGLLEEKLLQRACSIYKLKNELFHIHPCVVEIFNNHKFEHLIGRNKELEKIINAQSNLIETLQDEIANKNYSISKKYIAALEKKCELLELIISQLQAIEYHKNKEYV